MAEEGIIGLSSFYEWNCFKHTLQKESPLCQIESARSCFLVKGEVTSIKELVPTVFLWILERAEDAVKRDFE
jgi:hypothetical protein